MGEQPPTQGWGGRAGGTFADQQHAVVAEARGALAPEAPDLVDADATGADGGDLPTLVDVWGGRQPSGPAQPQAAAGGPEPRGPVVRPQGSSSAVAKIFLTPERDQDAGPRAGGAHVSRRKTPWPRPSEAASASWGHNMGKLLGEESQMREHRAYNASDMKRPEERIPRNREENRGRQGLGEDRTGSDRSRGPGFFLRDEEVLT